MSVTLFIVVLALMAASYAICGIPFGYLISLHTAGVDVTQAGSGNIGSTNVTRTVGAKAGALTLLLDACKGFFCVAISRVFLILFAQGQSELFVPTGPLGWTVACVFLACVCGHVYSPYLGFKGGKGIACGFGAMLALSWILALVILVVFVIVALLTRYVSAASISASVALPIAGALVYWPFNWGFELPLIVAACIVVWAHRLNMQRLQNGTESAFSFHGSKETSSERESSVDEKRATVRDVEIATREAAKASASEAPRAGTTYTFWDEKAVESEVDDALRTSQDLNAKVDEVEHAIYDASPRYVSSANSAIPKDASDVNDEAQDYPNSESSKEV